MNDLLAMKTAEGKLLAFHARNLEVAQISHEAWETLSGGLKGLPLTSQESFDQLRAWDKQDNPSSTETNPAPTILVNVTQVCNLHCTYCAAGGDGSYGDPVKKISVEKTIPQIYAFMNRLEPGQFFQINFLGGEPLLFPEGIQVLADAAREYAKPRGIDVQFRVTTNGTLMTERNLQLLADLKAKVTVSLDGPAEINDRVRPTKSGKPSTADVVDGLQKLLARKSDVGEIQITAVFGKDSDLLKAYQFLRQFDVDGIQFDYNVQESSREVNEAFISGMNRIAFLAFNAGGEAELRRIHNIADIFATLDSQRKVMNYCQSGKSFFAIDARNNLYTCPWLVGKSKEIVGHGTQLWAEKLVEYQNPLVEKQSCQDCWARYLCGGGCMAVHENKTGDRHQVDQLFCERTRQIAALAIMYYEKCLSADGLAADTQGAGHEI